MALPAPTTLLARLAPLHDGPHDSASDLTAGDWAILAALLLGLVAIAYGLYKLMQRRRGDGP